MTDRVEVGRGDRELLAKLERMILSRGPVSQDEALALLALHRKRAVEEAARVADRFADGNATAETTSLDAARRADSISGREVAVETAVGFAKRSGVARSIAAAIRSLATPQQENGR